MGFRRHLLIQKAPMGFRGHLWPMGSRGPLRDSEGTYWFRRLLWDPEGTYGIQRAPMGFRGPLWDSEDTYGIQRGTQKGYIGPIFYPEGVSVIQRTWISEYAYKLWIGGSRESQKFLQGPEDC